MLLLSDAEKATLKYKCYSFETLLIENDFLPDNVKLSAYISTGNVLFLDSFDKDFSTFLIKEHPFLRNIFINLNDSTYFERLDLLEVSRLIFFFEFTPPSIHNSLVTIILELQFNPYSFLSILFELDALELINKIGTEITSSKFKKSIYLKAREEGVLIDLLHCEYFKLNINDIKSYDLSDELLLRYFEVPRTILNDTEKAAFECIKIRLHKK